MKNASAGFTLVEMLVSVAVFAIVMMMVSSAYLVIIASNRQAQALASGADNLAFALDTMTRAIRTGASYSCGGGGDCFPSPGGSFSFTDAAAERVTYSLSGGVVMESINGTSYALTDSSVTITTLSFYTQGTASTRAGDYLEPQVLISISGTVVAGAGKIVPFSIETSSTMRTLDL